jgi:Flp pilus assembly protein TadD/TolA-binding protein
MLRLLYSLCVYFSISLAGGPWCQADQQLYNQTAEAQSPEADESIGAPSDSPRQEAGRHPQEVMQQKSSESAVTRPHDFEVESKRQDPELDEILERPSVHLLDKQMPYGGTVLLAPPAPQTPPAPPAPRTLSDIEKAWNFYQQGNYDAATATFSSLIKAADKNLASNARLGLAYTRLKQGRKDQALMHFQRLVQDKYRLSETLPVYLELLLQNGDYAKAQNYISQLPVKKRAHWERRILEAKVTSDFNALPERVDYQTLSDFLLRNEPALSRCIRTDLFFEIARRMHEMNADAPSAALSKKLLACELPRQFRYGILSLLADSAPQSEALALVRTEKTSHLASAPEYLKKLEALELVLLKRRLNTLPLESAERVETAKAILSFSPQDPDALSAIAWHQFNNQEFSEAAENFSRLLRVRPNDKSAALGLGYCRLNLGEFETALSPLQEHNIPDDPETLALKKQVYKKQAEAAYDAQNWSQAASYFEKILLIDPEDVDTKQRLSWTRYHQGRYAEARTLMEQSYAGSKTPQTASWLMDIYSGMSAEKPAYNLARDLREAPQAEMKAIGADFYFDHRAPITASQTLNSPEKCYFNAASPRLETFLYYHYKDGESGLSKMMETALPITAVVPTEVGKQWSFTVTPKYLSSGNAPNEPFAGSYYNLINGTPQLNDLEDDFFVWQPDIGFEKEGRIFTSIHAGSTPFTGAVSPTPTFQLQFGTSNWQIDLHRCNVKDSTLSYIGLEDPYRNRDWGRVTRNGLLAGYTWSFLSDYWLSAAGGYNFYDGQNVWDNDSYHLYTAVGRTLWHDRDEISYGLFFTAQHYRRNSDFYTFGHGGYYSPQVMTWTGPFFRYRSALCRGYWFDFEAALGWLHQELDGSPFYPLFDGDVDGLNSAAADNALAEYNSRTKDELGYVLKLQGMKQLNGHLAAGGFVGFEKNTEYESWQVGLGLHYYFDLQNLFWKTENFFNTFGSCSNK